MPAAPLLVAAAFLATWQAVHALAGADLISAPVPTFLHLAHMLATERFWLDAGQTGLAFLWSVLLSLALGILAGVALGLNRATGDAVEPLLVTFYALPKVTLYPLVLLAFGLGLPAKVAFGVMHGLVPITLLTRNAIAQLKPVYLRSARTLRLRPAAAIRRIVLPAIVPDLVAGARIGASLSLLGVLIGEMFAAQRGLGFAAMGAMGLGDTQTILALGTFLALFAIAINTLLLALERRARHGA